MTSLVCVLLDVNRIHLSNTSFGDGLCEGGEFAVHEIEVIFWLTDKNLTALGCAYVPQLDWKTII